MTWFKVDDGFHSHPKAAAASLAAIGLWTVAGAWCGDHLTDGNVPDHMILSLSRGVVELADELVTCGLWRRTRSGYRFHQWDVRNPLRTDVETMRTKRAEAGRKGGVATRSKREANASARASPLLEPPTRPDPPPSKGRGEGGAPASPGGTRPPNRHSRNCPYKNRDPETCAVCASERKAPTA